MDEVRSKSFTIKGEAKELNKKAMEKSRQDVIEYIKKCNTFVFVGREEDGKEGRTISSISSKTVLILVGQVIVWIDKIAATLRKEF